MNEILLTIAIPTYNRSNLLDESLSYLLPQVALHKNEIQLVISDNHSTDNTAIIIEKYKRKFPDIKLKISVQEENLGYYGNFKKCRELSCGKYLWILSDDFQVLDRTVEKIIDILRKKEVIGALYLNPQIRKFKSLKNIFIESPTIDFDHYFKIAQQQSTYVSKNIILNRKNDDNIIFEKYKNNDLIGFILMINSIKYSNKVVVLTGHLIRIKKATANFNVFKVWVNDISNCINLLKEAGLLKKKTIDSFVNSILKSNIKFHYINAKYKNIDLDNIEKEISKQYSSFIRYWIDLFPYFFIPRCFLCVYFIIRKLIVKIKRGIMAFSWLVKASYYKYIKKQIFNELK